MALPDLSKMNAYQLMRLAENRGLLAIMLVDNRRAEGRPDNDVESIEEILWLSRVSLGDALKEALETLPLEKALRGLGLEMGLLRGPGRAHDFIHVLAWWHMQNTGLKPMQIYYQWVQPVLVANGVIPLTAKGAPDPIEDQAARRAFLKALANLRKNSQKIG